MSGRVLGTRILAEGFVIVVSILLAFGIDAWWEDRGVRAEERTLLLALEAEFRGNAVRLASAFAWYEERYTSARRILELFDAEVTTPGADETRSLLGSLLSKRSFYLETGAHDALLASGDLAVISDEELRNRLAAWPRMVAEWQEEDLAVFRFTDDEVAPFLATSGRLRDIGPDFAGFSDAPPTVPRRDGGSFDASAIWAGPGLDNVAYRRAQGLWHAMRDGSRLRDEAEEILEMLQRSLGR